MKATYIKTIISILFLLLLMSCESESGYINPIRKNIEPSKLSKELRNDSLMYMFKGYGVTPRNERTGIYLVSREKEKGLYHWVNYNPNGTKYSIFYNSYLNDDSVIVKLTAKDSLEILNKAHELIGICKKIDLRWAGWESGRFDCYFNDSTRMTYVENRSDIDSNFYRFHRNLIWIDSNFVTYE